jgi:hypothetical protein
MNRLVQPVVKTEIVAGSGPAFKVCRKCDTPKPLTDFHANSAEPDGKRPHCKECVKLFPSNGKKQRAAYAVKYYSANKTRIMAQTTTYYRNAIETRFFYSRARCLQRKELTKGLLTKELARLWHRQKGKCALTSVRLTRDNSELDHVLPLSRGGDSAIENLRWTTAEVNRARGNMLDSEFIALCHLVVKHHEATKG